MIPIDPRPPLSNEQSVIKQALERAAISADAAALAAKVASLRVVAKCGCGCASVDFAASKRDARPRVVADALAKTSAGNTVGLLLWGTDEELTGLEVYSMSAPDDASLPMPETVARW